MKLIYLIKEAALTVPQRLGVAALFSTPIPLIHGEIKKHNAFNNLQAHVSQLKDNVDFSKVPKNVKLVRDITEYTPTKNHITDYVLEDALKNINNAFYHYDSKQLIYPKNLKSNEILQHELGHSVQGHAPEGVFKNVLSTLINPKNSPIYKHEQDAWNIAKVPESSLTRQLALKTYEESSKSPRNILASLLLSAGGTLGLTRRRRY